MQTNRTSLAASLVVLGTGALWGLYWIPVRRLAETALPGAWGTLAIVAAAALLLAPVAAARRRQLAAADRMAVAAVALGGAAFVLYSVAFVHGRVAIVILLFFLTPVWSTLIGRVVMGWPAAPLRLAAIAVGMAGLAVMLGADGGVPLPRGAGEWLALLSGLLWSVATTGIRTKAPLGPGEAAFVFAAGACVGAAALVPLFAPLPAGPDPAGLWAGAGWALAAGGLWWGLSMAGLMWATARLEPARVGILLMTEVLVGAASAAWLADEQMGRAEIAGGALVLVAALLEVWPLPRRRRGTPR
ncbi:DMT family transporter [Roseovarius salinarum]|uniref:DMT family transporter n=1 Tax=Roseovarius salinarum TaxID=1981892 RepID=UPI000C330937|nr:DMT family transporter [Roseovarius salinarum]